MLEIGALIVTPEIVIPDPADNVACFVLIAFVRIVFCDAKPAFKTGRVTKPSVPHVRKSVPPDVTFRNVLELPANFKNEC